MSPVVMDELVSSDFLHRNKKVYFDCGKKLITFVQ